MKASLVSLFFGVVLLAAVDGSSLSRDRRQAWSFPDQVSSGTTLRTVGTTGGETAATTAATPATLASTTAATGFSTSTQPPGPVFTIPNCNCPAPPQFNPVCGSDGNTYVNRQKLSCARRCGYNVSEVRMGAC